MSENLDLFGPAPPPKRDLERIGDCEVSFKEAKSILSPATGFMATYDYTLNPYSGCSFGCTYCYAAFFSRNQALQDTWGGWVTAKENAARLMQRFKPNALDDKAIYASSVTDPYQPVEKKIGLTREVLSALVESHQPNLVIQTRSPLVTRDLDLLKRFKRVQVNMTVTTDSEDVRRVFEPTCPSNRVRLQAIAELQAEGIRTCITMTPLLPVENADEFADLLLGTGVTQFIVQPFHATKGKFVAGTRDAALELLRTMRWDEHEYQRVYEVLKSRLPNLGVGKNGFSPPPL